MSGEIFFHNKSKFFFTKTLMIMMIMKMNVMISRMSFLFLNKYWECHQIIEYLKIYSWSKQTHVKQINEFLMAMWNMWWHFRIFFRSDSFSKLPDWMSDKLSWIFDMSAQVVVNPTTHFKKINICFDLFFNYYLQLFVI